ncbi:hypothetical protein Gotri_000024 [Gossypium trilobum]|uniref:DUF547 domain-containing protein n=1 Tax=Gossypium trilobum TaxID=34281 RepID=A0A7J9FVT2_9ROSI|nr:hypothetical protein [Gossypium trilobum]
MVEGEIARLESQISQLRLDLKQEKEATKAKQWQPGSLMSYLQGHPSTTSNPNPIKQGGQEKVVFETKALHFISKAIKGDYTLSDFSLNERMDSRLLSEQKENQFQGEVKFQERVPRKSSLLKAASPLRDPRHPSPKSNQNWHPNKLSENIMKCLNFIFVRLLRTSRAMELEKSGPITRFMSTPLSSRSFRVESTLNPKSSLGPQKESRQQDPYGIFDMEESIPRDIGPYKNLGADEQSPESGPEIVDLPAKISILDQHGYLQYGVPNTPEKFLTLMNKATLNVGGNTISAQAMEHYILRKPASSNMKEKDDKDDQEAIVRKLYGLQLMDPNVTFALSCGTRSSPAVSLGINFGTLSMADVPDPKKLLNKFPWQVRIYTADGVAAELEKSKLEYLQASIAVTNTKKIALPELLLRNMFDFSVDMTSLVQWVCQQLPTSGSLRKSMVDCFRSHNSGKVSITVEKIPYDFEFQYLLAM